MLHELTITDLSSSFRDPETLLFRTPDAAAGFAARRGTLGGYIVYELDGRLMQPLPGDEANAEAPVGCKLHGRTKLFNNTPERIPTNPGTYGGVL